jgi:hypothetical protein
LEEESTYQPNRAPRYQREYDPDEESSTKESSAEDDSLPDLVIPAVDYDDVGSSTTEEVNQVPDKEPRVYKRKADAEFAIKEITIPTSTEAHTKQAKSTPSWLINPEPEVGSHHEQILASWRSIFDRPIKPTRTEEAETTPEAGDEPNNRRRFRQEQLNSMDPDMNKPYGC